MARNILRAICLNIEIKPLPTFLGQQMFDIELNAQFCPKNVGRTRVFMFELMAHKILR